jgi:ParB family chromosome partitioning protein
MRSDAFTLEPERITLVTDPNHPLYDPRVHDDPDESMVRNIMIYGVIEPVVIRNNGETVEVIDGRGRVKAALEANRRLTAEGKQPIRVPAIIRRGPDADMFGVLISANECRREDNPLLKSVKAQRLLDMGKTVEEVAIAFGVRRQSVESWLALGDVAQPVLDAVEAGEISATAAAQLSHMERAEQVKTFEQMKAEGGKLTVGRAKQAAREGDTVPKPPKPKMRSRREIDDVLYHLHGQIRSNPLLRPTGFRLEYEQGFCNALRWVLEMDEVQYDKLGGNANIPNEDSEQQAEVDTPKDEEDVADEDWIDEATIMYGADTKTFEFSLKDVRLIPALDAEKAGACEDCPLAYYGHVMMASKDRPYTSDKFCTKPFVQKDYVDLGQLMSYGGTCRLGDDYVKACEMPDMYDTPESR